MGKATAKKITFFSAIISLVSFAYKMTLGVITMSMVLMIASLSTLMVFICKLMFVKNVTKTREKKKRGYLVMILACLAYSTLFILFVVLKVAGIDTSNQNTYEGWLGILFIAFIFIMFILSIINLRGALEKTDLMVIGLKEMTFISALTDVVIIEEFVARTILEYQEVPYLDTITSYVPLGIGVIMILTSLFMFIRFKKYEV